MASSGKEKFGGKAAYILALAGSAIGLGNVWRFPYMVGEHGGAAFIIVYVICAFLISLPIFLSEAVIGRTTGLGPYEAMNSLAPKSPWKGLGILAVVSSFIILSYYCVVGGWAVDYLCRSFIGGIGVTTRDGASALFGSVAGSVCEPLVAHAAFLLLTAVIIYLGVQKGIELFSKVSIPLLFVMMVIVTIYSVRLPGAEEGVRYLVKPDFSKIDASAVASALGQSFFSMSLGVGMVLTYTSYSRNANVVEAGAWTAIFDTLFAILAGFAVMPAVFAGGLVPEAGPSLVFEALPYVFGQMAVHTPIFSRIVTILFFMSILLAALSSSISLLETCVNHLMERRNFKRGRATLLFVLLAWALGVLCSLSFGPLGGIKIFGQTIFGFCDLLTSNYLMTLGALAFAIFVGWRMDRLEIQSLTGKFFHFMIKWIVPLAIIAIFVSNLIL